MDSILGGGCWKEARDETDGGKGEGGRRLAGSVQLDLVPRRNERSVAGSDGPTCSSVLRDVHAVPRTSKQTRSLSCIVRVVFCRTSSEIRSAVQGAHPWQGQVSEYVQVTRA